MASSIGQLTCHACVIGQNMSCVHAVVLNFVELLLLFFMKTFSLCLKFCRSFDKLVTGLCVIHFCLFSYSWLTNWTPPLWWSNFVCHLYDYRLNWTPHGPITIINIINNCDFNCSLVSDMSYGSRYTLDDVVQSMKKTGVGLKGKSK